MHAAKRRTLIFNSSLLVPGHSTVALSLLQCDDPLLILIKPKDYAAPQMSACGTSVWTGRALQAESDDLEVIGLALLYPALERNVVFLAIMDIRAHPVSFSERPREAGRATRSRMRRRDRFSISSFQLADLGGKANYCYRDQFQTWGGGHPLSGCGLRDARLIAALLCQHGPSDPRQLVGEGSGQNVRMQALSGANEPESEAVLRPVRRPQQNDPGCLHEECSQVTVAALGDAPENGSISGRHLLRDEAEPS